MSEHDDVTRRGLEDQRDAASDQLEAEARRQLRPQGFQTGRLSRASETANSMFERWIEDPCRKSCEHVDLDRPAPMLMVDGVLQCFACGTRARDASKVPTHCDACGTSFAFVAGRVDALHQLGAVGFPMALCEPCASN